MTDHAADITADTPDNRGSILFGLTVIAGLLLAFGLWSVLAPLSTAAVAPGVVRVDSNRKTVQHLEGGIIAEILVREGDRVGRGQPVVRLDETQAEASHQLLKGQLDAFRARAARIKAEQTARPAVAFPADLTQRRTQEAAIADILMSQEEIFTTRRARLDGELTILGKRLEQLASQISAYGAQRQAALTQLEYIVEEIADVSLLYRKGLVPKQRVLALQREQANLTGAVGEYDGLIARANEQIGETESQIINVRSTYHNELAEEHDQIRNQIADTTEKLRSAEDVLQRRFVLAPESGVVVDLRFFTPGGVIGPGEPIMDIVPQQDRLLVEARIQPIDIDVVATGMPAQIRLTAFNQRIVPTLDGIVVHVSADSMTDPNTASEYFMSRVEVDRDQLAKLTDVHLMPGMPAEVMIVTGERTLIDYLITPVTNSFARALREQ